VAACIPRSLNDARKWLELHLAEYRRQTALVEDSSAAAGDQAKELKAPVAAHTESTKQATTAM